MPLPPLLPPAERQKLLARLDAARQDPKEPPERQAKAARYARLLRKIEAHKAKKSQAQG
jgi:hypothetical protein